MNTYQMHIEFTVGNELCYYYTEQLARSFKRARRKAEKLLATLGVKTENIISIDASADVSKRTMRKLIRKYNKKI